MAIAAPINKFNGENTMPGADNKKGIWKERFEFIAYLWKKPLFKFVAYACVSIAFVTVAAYCLNFGKFNNISKQTDDWAEFGDYFGGVLNPAIAIVNLLVAAYIATELSKIQEDVRSKKEDELREVDNLRKKQTLAFNLHQEWNSREMYLSRTKAGSYVESHSNFNFEEIEHSTELYVIDLWIVLGFFQRLSALMKQGEVNDELAVKLFLPLFAWWWVKCFKKLPRHWDGWQPIKYLDIYFMGKAKSRYAAWRKRYGER
jgi:hypothetical protein